MADWSLSVPADNVTVASLPGHIRNTRNVTEIIIEREHKTIAGDTSAPTGGEHLEGSAVVNEGTTTPTKTVSVTGGSVALSNIARDRGRLWIDDNYDPPVLKRWDGSAWEVITNHITAADATAFIIESEEDANTDGAMDTYLKFRGFKDAAGDCDLAHIKVSHDGTSDDQKGMLGIFVNDGDDDNAPSKETIRFKSTGKIKVANSLCVLDEDDMVSDDAEVLATQQSIKAFFDARGVNQIVNNQTGAVATTTTSIPNDDSIPQNTEGGEFMTLAITPASATSKLKIDVVLHCTAAVGTKEITVALFQDSTVNALAAMSNGEDLANRGRSVTFTHYMTSGTTSSTTFKVRAGMNDTTELTFNGIGGNRRMGGVMASSITITEYK